MAKKTKIHPESVEYETKHVLHHLPAKLVGKVKAMLSAISGVLSSKKSAVLKKAQARHLVAEAAKAGLDAKANKSKRPSKKGKK